MMFSILFFMECINMLEITKSIKEFQKKKNPGYLRHKNRKFGL